MDKKPDRGTASLKLEKTNGALTVEHGTDGTTLLTGPIYEGGWDKIIRGILRAAPDAGGIMRFDNEEFMKDTLEDRELATILAALRVYQELGYGTESRQPIYINEIATNCGEFNPLDDQGIDTLCEKLNGGER